MNVFFYPGHNFFSKARTTMQPVSSSSSSSNSSSSNSTTISPNINLTKAESGSPYGFESLSEKSVTTTKQAVSNYCQIIGLDHQFSEEALIHLSWYQNNSVVTSESVNSDLSINYEAQRSLVRLQCFKLLCSGDDKSYEHFVNLQPENNKLKRNSFKKLSSIIASQPNFVKEATEASCYLTIGDEVKKKLDQSKIFNYPSDSEQFLTYVMENYPEVFPIYNSIHDSSAKTLLRHDLFPENTHFRHMLYTEGGFNMFNNLVQKIQNRQINKNKLDSWICRWIVNIAGFKAVEKGEKIQRTKMHGSVFLMEDHAQAMFILIELLYKNLSNKNSDSKFLLESYLQEIAKVIDTEKSLYLTHLSCLMKKFTKEDAASLKEIYFAFSEEEQKYFETSYESFLKTTKETPTFEPSIFANLEVLRATQADELALSLEKTVRIYLMITDHVNKKYSLNFLENEKIQQRPICYRKIADLNTLKQIVLYYNKHGIVPDLIFNPEQNVILSGMNS